MTVGFRIKQSWDRIDPASTADLHRLVQDALPIWGLDSVDGVAEAVGEALVVISRDGCRAALSDRLSA